MTDFEITIRPDSWLLTCGGVTLEATGAIRDRSVVRCVLAARQGDTLLYRDTANLTGERSRRRILQRINEVAPSSALPEATLLALDEAIRRTLQQRRQPSTAETICDTPSDFSGEVRTMGELTTVVRKWLLLDDNDALPIMLGTIAAHRLGGESPWLLLIAPPSGTKTELLRMTWTTPGIFPLSELTARTFASGLDTEGADPSLLSRLSDEILVLKDLTTLLEMHRDERQAVLAQLREIYDGRFDKVWGTGKELHWTGRLGFLAGVTPVIDQHHAVMALLGPRFVQLRMLNSDRCLAAERAMENGGQEHEMRAEMAGALASFLAHLPAEAPKVAPPVVRWLARVADLVTRARSPVLRDGWQREFEYAPEPELPARLARQLHALLRGITLVSGRLAVGEEDMRRVARVARDCIPGIRRKVLDELSIVGDWLKTTEVANQAQIARTTVGRTLEDLQALGLTRCQKGGQGVPDKWMLTDECHELFLHLATFPEKSEGCHTKTESFVASERPLSEVVAQPLPGIGDLVWLLSEDGQVQNAEPWRIQDIAEAPGGEAFALFSQSATGWPLERCRVAEREETA